MGLKEWERSSFVPYLWPWEWKKDILIEQHNELMQALRGNYYPACSKPDHVLGISPHTDTSTISILLQEDNINGLQIWHDGEWVPVKPVPNALVVNIGDVTEIWSNGKYNSIEHRAVTNENKSRLSFASFLVPHDDVEVEPFAHIVESHGSKRMYKKFKYEDCLRQTMSRKMEGKALKWQRMKLEHRVHLLKKWKMIEKTIKLCEKLEKEMRKDFLTNRPKNWIP